MADPYRDSVAEELAERAQRAERRLARLRQWVRWRWKRRLRRIAPALVAIWVLACGVVSFRLCYLATRARENSPVSFALPPVTTFTVRVSSDGGSTWRDTSLSCTITGDNQTCRDSEHRFDAMPFDLVEASFQSTGAGSAAVVKNCMTHVETDRVSSERRTLFDFAAGCGKLSN